MCNSPERERLAQPVRRKSVARAVTAARDATVVRANGLLACVTVLDCSGVDLAALEALVIFAGLVGAWALRDVRRALAAIEPGHALGKCRSVFGLTTRERDAAIAAASVTLKGLTGARRKAASDTRVARRTIVRRGRTIRCAVGDARRTAQKRGTCVGCSTSAVDDRAVGQNDRAVADGRAVGKSCGVELRGAAGVRRCRSVDARFLEDDTAILKPACSSSDCDGNREEHDDSRSARFSHA